MVESKLTYEECRRQRVEENKKRMEELNLLKLAQDLKPSTPQSTPVKKGRPRARLSAELSSVPLRRSGRMADKPPPNYKEMAIEPFERIRRNYPHRALLDRVRASDEVRLYAIERADKLELELGSEYPTFVKPMLQSHVSGGFWLGLPTQFCKKHLPLKDEMITLVDENGDESETKYLANKTGLSGGWRGFSIDHGLVDGDALVFQLLKPTEFKVYIIRAHRSDEDDNEESKENDDNDDVTPSSRRGNRKRSRQSDKVNNEEIKEDNENNDVTPSYRNAKRTRARRSDDDDNDNEKSKEDITVIGVIPSGKNTKRTRPGKK